MELTQEQKDKVMMWITSNLFSDAGIKNVFKKDSIRLHNQILIMMAKHLAVKTFVTEETILNWIMREFFTIKPTAKRYIERIIAKEVFVFDEMKKEFYLPKQIVLELEDTSTLQQPYK